MRKIFIIITILININLVSIIVSCQHSEESYKEFYKKGKKEYCNQNYELAIEYFSKTVKIAPDHSGAYAFRGDSYFKCGKISNAFIDYNNSLKYNPKYVRGLFGNANAKYYIGDYIGSIIYFNKTITVNKNHITAHNQRGLAKQKIGDIYGALKDFEQAIILDSNFANAYYNKAIVLFKLSDYEEAIDYFSNTLKIKPNHSSAYAFREDS